MSGVSRGPKEIDEMEMKRQVCHLNHANVDEDCLYLLRSFFSAQHRRMHSTGTEEMEEESWKW